MAVFVVFQLPFGIAYLLELDYTNDKIELIIILALLVSALLVICWLNFKIFCLAETLRQSSDITLGRLDGSEQRARDVETQQSEDTFASLEKISTCLLAVVCLFICYSPSILDIVFNLTNELDWSRQTMYVSHCGQIHSSH
jgi:4-amino-4-deoxy-L-arabinose transferase-like glycosyltransferase